MFAPYNVCNPTRMQLLTEVVMQAFVLGGTQGEKRLRTPFYSFQSRPPRRLDLYQQRGAALTNFTRRREPLKLGHPLLGFLRTRVSIVLDAATIPLSRSCTHLHVFLSQATRVLSRLLACRSDHDVPITPAPPGQTLDQRFIRRLQLAP